MVDIPPQSNNSSQDASGFMNDLINLAQKTGSGSQTSDKNASYDDISMMNLPSLDVYKLIEILNTAGKTFEKAGPVVEKLMKHADDFLNIFKKFDQLADTQKQAFKDFGSAVKGLVEATFTVKDGFDTAKQLTKLSQQAAFQRENLERFLLLRNILHRKGLDDDKFLTSEQKLSNLSDLTKSSEGRKSLAKDKDYKDYRFFGTYNPELFKDKNGKKIYDILDRFEQLQQAYLKALQDPKISPADVRRHLEGVFGDNTTPYAWAMQDQDYQKIKKQESFNAQSLSENAELNKQVFEKKSEQETTKKALDARSTALIGPVVNPIVDGLTSLMHSHFELLSRAQAYGALGVEAYKFGDFFYKLWRFLQALGMDHLLKDKKKDKGNKDRGEGGGPTASAVVTQSSAVEKNKGKTNSLESNKKPPLVSEDDHSLRKSLSLAALVAVMTRFAQVAGSVIMRLSVPVLLLPNDATDEYLNTRRKNVFAENNSEHNGGDPLALNPHSRLPYIQSAGYYGYERKINPSLQNTLLTKALAGKNEQFYPNSLDMVHANQYGTCVHMNNNQQYHVNIVVQPSTADPMQIAQQVYHKFTQNVSHLASPQIQKGVNV